MSFTGSANAGMAKFAKSMRNGMDNCKVDGKITEQEKKIKTLTTEIGNLALLRLEAGEQMGPEIMERYAAIQEAKETILALEGERKKSVLICPTCGEKTSLGMTYCGVCGAKLTEER